MADWNRKGPAGRKPAPRRPAPPPKDDKATRLRGLIERGIPEKYARQVVNGQKDLNAVLLEMANEDRIHLLEERHGLSRALACQVVRGLVDLDRVLLRMKLEKYRSENPDRSVFSELAGTEKSIALGLHGRLNRTVRVIENGVYDFSAMDAETGIAETIHKTRVKYAHRPEDGRLIRRVMTWDKELRKVDIEPKLKPQERYDCSDRWLFQQMEQKSKVILTLVEGEQFQGTITWIGRFEIGISLKGGLDVYIMRHALASASHE